MIIKKEVISVIFLLAILFLSSCSQEQPTPDTPVDVPVVNVTDVVVTDVSSGDDLIKDSSTTSGCNCSDERVWVCGEDGRLYVNACQADCLNVNYVEGECNTRVNELQMFPCGETGGGMITSTNSVCGKIVADDGFVKWKTFPTSQTACGFRDQGISVKEYTRGDCQ